MADDNPEAKDSQTIDVSEIHNELQILESIELNKRPLTEWERSRRDELNETLRAEPELKKMLVDLETRQRKEADALIEKHERAGMRDDPELVTRYEMESDFLHQQFREERQRQIRQFHRDRPANDNLTFKAVQFEGEPELVALLKRLEDRQRNEALELAAEHERALRLFGNDPKTLEHHQELAWMQEQRFIDEHDRCVVDYFAAQELREQMRQDAEDKALEHGREDDGPKFTR
jgi:hypothetical protein